MSSVATMDLTRRCLIEIASARMTEFACAPDHEREDRKAELVRLDGLITEATDWIEKELKAAR